MQALPAPVEVAARWPAHRQLTIDLARAGTVGGLVVGAVLGDRWWGLAALVIGAVAGAGLGWWIGPRRYRLVLDADGIRIGRLFSTVRMSWPQVDAFGVVDTWTGRRGRLIGLAVCRRGVELPITVPACTFHETGWRIGAGPRPEEAVEAYRPALLAPVANWAEAMGVPCIPADLDTWWELHQR